ncbi:MAG: TlpA family protein disulfide reductase [Chitinophagaceae bacterium]|nr:TlpA family protein disulfide reductase [Chitinophagaceae bacterium]
MKLLFYCLLAMLWPAGNAVAQTQAATIRPLSIGDTVPDVTLSNLINHPVSKIQLSSLKGKLIVFDFFASWCGSCFKELPRLNELQEKYKKDLQVIVVCYEPAAKLQKIFNTKRIPSSIKLPFVTSDSLLKKFFPHKLLPHEVWMDSSGKIIAITSSEHVTASNIEKAIAGRELKLPVKSDVFDYDVSMPLLENSNGGSLQKLFYKSLLTGKLDGMVSGSKFWKDSFIQKHTWLNRPILSLYQDALKFPANRIVLEVKDELRYKSANDYLLYCYELITPKELSEHQLNELMLADLNRYLNLYGRMELRQQPCYVLRITNKEKLPLSKVSKPFQQIGADYNEQVLNGYSLSLLTMFLNMQQLTEPQKPIVLNETGFTGRLDLRLPLRDLNNLEELKKALHSFGLTLEPAVRNLEVFVLSEHHFKKPNTALVE